MHTWTLLVALLAGCPTPGPDTGVDTDADTDADTAVDDDRDNDGYRADEDCDDDDPDVHPGAEEICDGKDSDCEGGPHPDEADDDGDGTPDCRRCDLAGYWLPTRDLSEGQVEGELRDLTAGLSCDYSSTTTYMFTRIDNHDYQVECVYTGRTTTVVDQKPDPDDDMNTEHTWPQSQGAGEEPARCDLHHLYPSDVDANQKRAAHPLGEVAGSVQWSQGGSLLGDDSWGDTVFEPRDAHKGNAARSMLYFALRYGYSLPGHQVDLFLDWHAADPVDDAEWARTRAIADYQGFENPFVACPDLADAVY